MSSSAGDIPNMLNARQSSSAADDFAKLLQMQDHRGDEARRRDSMAKHPSLDGSFFARTSLLPSARGSGRPLHRRSSSRPEPLIIPRKISPGGEDVGGAGEGGESLFVDEKEWSNVMNNTLALLVFVFVMGIMYCCYTLIAPYQHGIGWGILLSVVFHKSGESLFAHGRARKSRREECLATMVRRRKEMKKVLARLLSSRRGGEHKPIRGCPAASDAPRRASVGDTTFRNTEDAEMERVQGFGFIVSYVSWIVISLLSRVVSMGVFLEYVLLEVGDTLGLKKLHYVPDLEKHYTAYHRFILCTLTYMVVGGTILAVGGPIGYLILHILAAASLLGFFLPYVTVGSYMPTALRLFRLVFIGGFTVLLGVSFYRDIGNVTETVTSGASYVLGDSGHMVGEFFTSIESRLLEDVARSFNASNVTKTAHDIRHALDPLLVQWSGSEDGEVRVLNWTEQINVIMSSFYSTTEIIEEAPISKREKRRRMRKAKQHRGNVNSTAATGVSSDDEEVEDEEGKPSVKPTTPSLEITTTSGPTPTSTPSSPLAKTSPGMLSTAQTLLGSLGTKLRPVFGVVLPLFTELFSNIMRMFDSIYELVLLTCVYRFCQAQQDSVLYYTIRKALSTVDPWTAPARARTLEEDIILQFLTLLQSFWHISWYHFSVTYICLELCAIPLPFLLGVTAVLMALFPLLTRFVSPVFVALYTILFNEIILSGNVSFLMGSILLLVAILCMFVQSGHRYVLMAVLYMMGFISIEDANHYDVFRWVVLLLGVAVLQNDEWLMTVRHSTHTRGARKSGGAGGPSSPSGGTKRGRGGVAPLSSSSTIDNSTSTSSFERGGISTTPFQQSGELPTFIVGTCVVLGLVTYGLPGVIVGPLLFIVAKATYDNIGWDIPADIIAATDAALRGGDPNALYEAVAMYTGETLPDQDAVVSTPNTDGNSPTNNSSFTSIKLSDEAKNAAKSTVQHRPSAANMLLQSHTGSSTFLRTAVWRALAQQRAGRMAGGVGSSNLLQVPHSGRTHHGSPRDVENPLTSDPRARSTSPVELDQSLDGTTHNATPASRSSSSDIGVHMSVGSKSSLKKGKA